jgi:hypothetical protein
VDEIHLVPNWNRVIAIVIKTLFLSCTRIVTSREAAGEKKSRNVQVEANRSSAPQINPKKRKKQNCTLHALHKSRILVKNKDKEGSKSKQGW